MRPLNIIFSRNPHFNIFYSLLLILVASLPFTQALAVPVAILMFINWICEWNWKEKWMNVKDHRATAPFLLSIAVFCISLFGLLISSQKIHALATIETYIWFLAAPLFLLTYASTLFTHERIRLLLVLFATSTILLSLMIFGDAAFQGFKMGWKDFSTYHFISEYIHPSYLALYMSFTIFLLLYELKMRRRQLPIGIKIIYGLLASFLYIAVISASSKAGLLLLLALCLLWIFFLASQWKYRLLGVLLFIALNVSFGAILYQFKSTPFLRMSSAWNDIKHFEINNRYSYTSSGIRLTVWRSAWEVAADHHFFGTGTGDLETDLIQNAEEKGYQNLIAHHYNAHNQWLQALAATGILGFLIVLGYCFYPFLVGIKKKDMLYITFSLLIIGNLLVESMFERKMGAVFISIVYLLLYLLIPKQEIVFNLDDSDAGSETILSPQSPSPEESDRQTSPTDCGDGTC